MKNIISKNFVIALIIGTSSVLPLYVLAQVTPNVGGTDTGGAENIIVPAVSGVDTGGAEISPAISTITNPTPPVSGGDTGGVDANTNASSTITVPPVSGGNTGGVDANTNASSTITVPPVSGGNTGGDATTTTITASTTPPVSGSNTGGAETSTTTATTTAPAVVIQPAISSGGGGGGDFYGGNSGGGSVGGIVPLSVPLASTTADFNSCPLITGYILPGANNSNDQVLKLQAFLNNTEGIPVSLTGVYDAQTITAVKAFQQKYLSQIMGPWLSTTPSGDVYITTRNKINSIACNTPLTLTPAELAIITAHNQALQNNGAQTTTPTPAVVGPTTPTTPVSQPVVGESTTTPTTTSPIGESTNSNGANTASVVNAPILERIWNFFKNIF